MECGEPVYTFWETASTKVLEQRLNGGTMEGITIKDAESQKQMKMYEEMVVNGEISNESNGMGKQAERHALCLMVALGDGWRLVPDAANSGSG
jgi:hypothetical protein